MVSGFSLGFFFVFVFNFFLAFFYSRCVFRIASESDCQLLCAVWYSLLLVKLASLSLIPVM